MEDELLELVSPEEDELLEVDDIEELDELSSGESNIQPLPAVVVDWLSVLFRPAYHVSIPAAPLHGRATEC